MSADHLWKAMALGSLILSVWLSARDVHAQQAPTTHSIFMTAIEIKGATTTETLAPPSVNPTTLSKGYGFKAPGEADKNAPQRWEVASDTFTPGFITVQQGDTVMFTVFVVNGDQHDVGVFAPDGQVVVPTATWNRGREYRVSFVAEKVGTYHLRCFTHAPTMTVSILVLPR
jgi:plastocyanin